MTTLAFYHIKGGVGKTATLVNLSFIAAQQGAKCLICDLDPQSSTTFYFRIQPKFKSGVKGFVKGGKRFEANIKGTDYENLDLLPAELSFRNLDIRLNKTKKSKQQLVKILEPFQAEYDYLFLDSPPNLNIVAENIISAADYLMIPVIPTPLAVRTYRQLENFFDNKKYNKSKIMVFFSMVEKRKKLHLEMMKDLSAERVMKSYIPFLSEIERMGVNCEPVSAVTPQSKASLAYQQLWDEMKMQFNSISGYMK